MQKLERKVKRGYAEGEREPSFSLRGRDSNRIKVLVFLQLKKRPLRKLKISTIFSKSGLARIPISKPQFLFLQNGDNNRTWGF